MIFKVLMRMPHSAPVAINSVEILPPPTGHRPGPGFHTWPGSADVLVGEYETGDSHPKK